VLSSSISRIWGTSNVAPETVKDREARLLWSLSKQVPSLPLGVWLLPNSKLLYLLSGTAKYSADTRVSSKYPLPSTRLSEVISERRTSLRSCIDGCTPNHVFLMSHTEDSSTDLGNSFVDYKFFKPPADSIFSLSTSEANSNLGALSEWITAFTREHSIATLVNQLNLNVQSAGDNNDH
jgi:hypothetical protein